MGDYAGGLAELESIVQLKDAWALSIRGLFR